MKRLVAGTSGFLYGLFLIWLYLLVSSHYNLSPTDKLPNNCFYDNCNILNKIFLFFDVVLPALLLCLVNIINGKYWTTNKLIKWDIGLTLVTFIYWVISYALFKK
jgi:hypothetical protein